MLGFDNKFNKIKEIAIAGNKDALDALPKHHRFKSRDQAPLLDVQKRGTPLLITPAGELAMEGKDEAVAFLREHGASVDLIAYGYALAGNTPKADEYFHQHKAQANLIAQGFEKGGHAEDAQKYKLIAEIQRKNRAGNASITTFEYRTRFESVQLVDDYEYPHELTCAIMQDAPKTPVLLNKHLFDLDALLQWHKTDPTHPKTRKPFTPNDIVPATEAINALKRIYEEHKQAPKEEGSSSSPKKPH